MKFKNLSVLTFTILIAFLCIFNSYASTATPSEATPKVYQDFMESLDGDLFIASSSNADKVDTSSDAVPSQDHMEMDDFDTLDSPMPMSSGGGVDNTIDFTGAHGYLSYYDSGNQLRNQGFNFNGSYFSVPAMSDYKRSDRVNLIFHRKNMPPAGKYKMSFYFGSNTGGFTYSKVSVYFGYAKNNASQQTDSKNVTVSQGSGDVSFSTTITVPSSFDDFQVIMYTSGIIPPYGGDVSVRFEPLSSSATTDFTPGMTVSGSDQVADNTGQIADNTAQQVAQGDTIIELIKNTIQTISSQLTAFWNQLAGEFTNLYNKMSTQHSEQLQADRDNTDDIIAADDANTTKVTTAIEAHGNFIIEGLKKLFIPSDEYFKTYFDDLYGWFSERFGFLSFPIDLLLEMIDLFINSSQVDCVLTLPSFTIMDNLLWPDMSFNLTEFLDTNFAFVVVAIKTVTSIYLVMAFVRLCEEKWNEVMMN